MARGIQRTASQYQPVASWLGQHGWVVGVALIGGGVIHQQFEKNKTPVGAQTATLGMRAAPAAAPGASPFARIVQALEGGPAATPKSGGK
jgi:hypothetical protein